MSTNSKSFSANSSESNQDKRLRNFLIAMVAIALSVALILGIKSQNTSTSLAQLDSSSTPLAVATTNGKPSLVEFYAEWCGVCQSMAPEMAQFKSQYGKNINFVMLNVDNTKWLPEMLKYEVDGIPHFVFLDPQGTAIAQTVGNQPRTIMASNLEALSNGSVLPYAQTSGEVSAFSAPVSPVGSKSDPRSHGGTVVN
ncbi:MAG: thioredoxin family protein [Cyanobacteria bacterium P01_A01_bin.45]